MHGRTDRFCFPVLILVIICIALSSCTRYADEDSYVPVRYSPSGGNSDINEHVRTLNDVYDRAVGINPETFGAVAIPGTQLCLPVMKSDADPMKYQRRDINGNYSVRGTPFVVYGGEAYDTDTVICGHYYRTGEVFGTVHLFVEDPSLIREHPVILFTGAEGVKEYGIVGAFEVESEELERAVSEGRETLRRLFSLDEDCHDALFLVTCMDYASSGRRRVLCGLADGKK